MGSQHVHRRSDQLRVVVLVWLAFFTCRFPARGEDPEWWSLRPIAHVPVPQVDDHGWSHNPVDRFIFAKLADAGRNPAPPAPWHVLARRVCLDLTGLPPTPEDWEILRHDHSPEAYERYVDRLLSSPAYAERIARHWLDLVRFAESDGFKADEFRPHAWRYRDYVIRSFQNDKPFDRFIQEQLAGDELLPEDPETLTATGYLRLWPLEDNQKDVRRQWTFLLNDITEVTSEVFLGLGMRCARCHDHKYDPLLQADYYRLQAFFSGMLPRDLPLPPSEKESAQWSAWERASGTLRREMAALTEPRRETQRAKEIQIYPDYVQAIMGRDPTTWGPLDKQYAYLAEPQINEKLNGPDRLPQEAKKRWTALQTQLEEFDPIRPVLPVLPCVSEVGNQAPPMYLGGHDQASAEQLDPGFPEVLGALGVTTQPLPQSTGRRSALAAWIIHPDNPLTRRVWVNRIWQQLFGVGIVATPNDFGHQGAPPTHPELLDWLAGYFHQQGWSVKQLHRLLVTSATYRQMACITPGDASDSPSTPDPKLGRSSLRRLDGEQIRDAMLLVSGELNLQPRGPSVPGDVARRSIYVRNVRNRYDELLLSLDAPDMFNSCGRRYVTTTPMQALLVVNAAWPAQRAVQFAERVRRCGGNTPEAFLRHAYGIAYLREPTPEEMRAGVEFLTAESDRSAAECDLCHALLCSNEFFFVE